jgi:NAD(P)-dependent dehydrogenase (short-subunit alcohol dehydrogenase family)
MSQEQSFESQTAVVVGGSSGFGRGVVEALVRQKMRVVAVALDVDRLSSVARETGAEALVADMADESAAWRILQDYRPNLVVLTAGASPLLRPIRFHTWETFSVNWSVDTKGTFVWLRNALLMPAAPGSHFIVTSSAAALRGSPLSGGYAGAKRTNWFLAEYAAAEAEKLGLGLRIHCIIPTLSPDTPIGRAASAAYAKLAGVDVETILRRAGPPTTPAIVGEAVVSLHGSPENWDKITYHLRGDGLTPVA